MDFTNFQQGIRFLFLEWIQLFLIAILVIRSWTPTEKGPGPWLLTFVGVMLLGGVEIWFWPTLDQGWFAESLAGDGIAASAKGMIWVGTVSFLLFVRLDPAYTTLNAEYYLLVIGMMFGAHFMCMAQNLLLMMVALEIVSVCAYLLVVHRRLYAQSVVASLRFLLFGLFATGLSLYGLSWWYGLTGSLELASLAAVHEIPVFTSLLIISMILGAFLFKVTAFPFHFWVAEVYDRVSYPLVALISTVPKIGGFIMLMRFWHGLSGPQRTEWLPYLLLAFAVLSLTYGNLAALAAKRFRRMMAFSGIAQAGFMLIALLWDSQSGYQALLFFLLIFTLMNIGGLLAVRLLLLLPMEDDWRQLAGKAGTNPAAGFLLVVAMAALTGLPPTAGFIAKWQVITAFFEEDQLFPRIIWIGVLVIIVLNTVISLFYYLRPVVQAYFRLGDQGAETPIRRPFQQLFVIGMSLPLVMFGIWGFDWIIDFLGKSVQHFMEIAGS